MKDVKEIKDRLMKSSDEKEESQISGLPEFKIRTMKDDLARIGLKGLQKEAKESDILKSIRKEEKKQRKKEKKKEKVKEISPPEKLPVAPEKAPLPTTEELVTEKPAPEKEKPKEIPLPPAPPEPEKPKRPEKIEKLEKPKEPKKLFKIPKPPKIKKLKPPKPKIVGPRKKPKFLFILIIILIAIGVGGFLYWQGTREPTPEPEPEPEPQPITPSESLILVDETKIASVSAKLNLLGLLEQESELEQQSGSFKRIAVLKNEQEFLSLTELFQRLKINVLPYVQTELKENYTLVLYSQNGKRHLGLITEIENITNLKEQLRFWEQTIVDDLENFFLGRVRGEPATPNFLDNIYKEVAIRYINFPEPDLTIDYAVVDNFFVLTTSKEAIYRIIDRIKGL